MKSVRNIQESSILKSIAQKGAMERIEKLMFSLLDEMAKINNRLDRLDNSLLKDEETNAYIRTTAHHVDKISKQLNAVSIPNEEYAVSLDEIKCVVGKNTNAIRMALARNSIFPINPSGKKKEYPKDEVFSLYASTISEKMDVWQTLGKRLNQ